MPIKAVGCKIRTLGHMGCIRLTKKFLVCHQRLQGAELAPTCPASNKVLKIIWSDQECSWDKLFTASDNIVEGRQHIPKQKIANPFKGLALA